MKTPHQQAKAMRQVRRAAANACFPGGTNATKLSHSSGSKSKSVSGLDADKQQVLCCFDIDPDFDFDTDIDEYANIPLNLVALPVLSA